MRRALVFITLLLVSGFFLVSSPAALAQGRSERTLDARIEQVYEGSCLIEQQSRCLLAKAIVFNSANEAREQTVQLANLDSGQLNEAQNLKAGDRIWVNELATQNDNVSYILVSPNRQTPIWIMLVVLIVFTVLVARVKGIMALLALAISTYIAIGILIPRMIAEPDLILVYGLLACVAIVIINQLIGHGLNKNSIIGLSGGLLSLGFVVLVSFVTSHFLKLNGLGAEGVSFLTASLPPGFSFRELFLVAIILSTSGALDDVTTSQATAVDELAKAQPSVTVTELFAQAMRVGTEHLVSMINTLFLAYLGVALPTLMVFQVINNVDLWVILSREDIIEEIARSFVSSLGLVLAIPATTWLACLVHIQVKPKWLLKIIPRKKSERII